MASYKLNIARIRGCPPPKDLTEALEDYGLPEGEEFGVLNHSATEQVVYATIVHRMHQTLKRLDREAKEVTETAVEKAVAYPFGVIGAKERLEIYAGSAGAIEHVGIFLASCLALPTVVDPIKLDIPAAVEKLAKNTPRFQLRGVRVSDYAHNSYMAGPYGPKFLDSQHGMDFMDKYAETLTSAAVKFQGKTGRINVTIGAKACFSYSCNEDDQFEAQSILRTLI